MKSFRFYDPATGLFSSRTIAASNDIDVAANTPLGLVAIEGDFDPQTTRVDLDSGELVDHRPPQPSEDHEWDESRKRWRLPLAALEAIAADNEARAEISTKEASQGRALRELVLELLSDEATRAKLSEKGVVALEKLQEVDAAVEAERPRVAEKGDTRGTA